MKYISTRGGGTPQNFSQVLMSGLAPDGGLYVPETWPTFHIDDFKGLNYPQTAEKILSAFIDVPKDDLHQIVMDVYGGDVFDSKDVTPIHKIDDNLFILELFHGPTLAFKDVALHLLGRLFEYELNKHNRRLTIVGATSGDTGSAAIEACRGRANIDVFILHPHNRTSEIQRKQMTSVLDSNIHNIAIQGNFDDCQNIVKAAFNDSDMRARLNISAINSINWARIIGQTVYYVFAAAQLKAKGIDKPNFAVPTGNFGNIYAAFVAKKIGIPLGKLVIGSNRNDILTRFFETGVMKLETVIPSLSPSMDIQISSNFERYLFELLGRDALTLNKLMAEFKETGAFTLPPEFLQIARDEFMAFRCSDDETIGLMKDMSVRHKYTLDPHTAVGLHAGLRSHLEPLVALACAHPAKFPDAVIRAVGEASELPVHLSDLMEREERMSVLPADYQAVKEFILGKQ